MAGSVVTSFSAFAIPMVGTVGQGVSVTAWPAWGPSIHSGFACPLLRLAASRRSADAATLGAFFSSAATTLSVHAAQASSVSLAGIASCPVHITTRSRRRTRAARECAPERGRYMCLKEAAWQAVS